MKTFIEELQNQGIYITFNNEKLKIQSNEQVSSEILEKIKSSKEELIQFFKSKETLKPTTEVTAFPLSSQQQRIWFSVLQGNESYNLCEIKKIYGNLDIKIFEQSLKWVLNRHAAFKTHIQENSVGFPLQFLQDIPNNILNFVPASGDLSSQIQTIVQKVIPVNSFPLWNFTLLQISENQFIFITCIHHIIIDGTSLDIFFHELFEVYNSLKNEKTPNLKTINLQYHDYCFWQKEFFIPENDSIEFWKKHFQIIPEPLDLSTKPRPKLRKYHGKTLRFSIDNSKLQGYYLLLKNLGLTHFQCIQGIIHLLLFRYSNQNQIVTGSPIQARNHNELQNIIGFFLEALPIYSEINPYNKLEDFLVNMKNRIIDSIANSDFSYDKIVDLLKVKTEKNRNPLFDIWIDVHEFENTDSFHLLDCKVEDFNDFDLQTAKFDLTFIVTPYKEFLEILVEFDTDLFDEYFIKWLFLDFQYLITHVEDFKKTQIKEIPIAKEHQFSIFQNSVGNNYPMDNKSIIQKFREQVQNKPYQIAVQSETQNLTFQELEDLSNQFANYLQKSFKIQKGNFVVIKMERSVEAIISLMSILKCGAIYVPIDLSYPIERQEFILNDCHAKILIDETTWKKFLLQKNRFSQSFEYINSELQDPIYCIYTSGSTGNPKGCLIHQQNLNNYLAFCKDTYFQVITTELDWFTPLAFDFTVTSIWNALTLGLTLNIHSEENSIYDIVNKILQNPNCKVFKFTPAHIYLISEETLSHRKEPLVMITGGEELSENHLKKLQKFKNVVIYNEYGPSETTVGTIVFKMDKKYTGKPLIGKPIYNTEIQLINEYNLPVPLGSVGEIAIAGESVGLGYWNRPQLNHEKFIQIDGKQYYKTGDLAVYQENGNLDFWGRKDFQVKIRGYRIELQEIENVLTNFLDIQQSVVQVVEYQSDKELAVFYVGKAKPDEIKNHLIKFLPNYMIPNFFISLLEIPLTPNGKVDRKKLQNFDIQNLGNEKVEIQNEFYRNVAKIWSEVLQIPVSQIFENSDFFIIGGNSLKAIKLVVELKKQLNISTNIQTLFKNSTLSTFCEQLNQKSSDLHQIQPVNLQNLYPLSPAQKRLWVLSQIDNTKIAYNVPDFRFINYPLNINIFQKSLQILVDKHEILRTIFVQDENGVPFQKVLDKLEISQFFNFQEFDNQEISNICLDFIQYRFNLENPPLWKIQIIKLSNHQYFVASVFHHIITDGASFEIFWSELESFYFQLNHQNVIENVKLNIHYKDFASWILEQDLSNSKKFWLEQFQGEIPILEFPTSFPRPKIKTFHGHFITQNLDLDTTNLLKQTFKNHGITNFQGLLASVFLLLNRYSHQKDIVIGTPSSGRFLPELQNQLGFYVNTLPIRFQLQDNISIQETFLLLKQKFLEILAHEIYPYDQLVNDLNLTRDVSRNPLFDVMVVLQNEVNNSSQWNFQTYYSQEFFTAKFDLTFGFKFHDNGLEIEMEFNTDIYTPDFVERILNNFVNLLKILPSQWNVKLSQLDWICSEEKNQILKASTFESSKQNLISSFRKISNDYAHSKALVFQQKSFTFKDLENISNQFANFLKSKGLKPKQMVLCQLPRTEWLVIGLLGILKNGSIFLPVDVNNPPERLNFIYQDSNAQMVLNEELINEFLQIQENYSNKFDFLNLQSSDIAYCIYTSGTTGQPKGCLVTHKNVLNLIDWHKDFYEVNNHSIATQFSNSGFDACLWEIFANLWNGACLHILSEEIKLNENELVNYLVQYKITHCFLPTAFFNQISEKILHNLKNVKFLVGGDTLKKYSPDLQIYNNYGPTEYTVVTTAGKVDSQLSIGKPIRNTHVILLNSDLQIVPLGAVGEICVTGDGLSNGYFNRPELQNEKFITNPYNTEQLLYCTGDLARWLPNGNLEFLGRKDDQVKIKGYRIELKEIENQILKFNEVEQVLVLALELLPNSEKELVAYIVGSVEIGELKSKLNHFLPNYMIPNYFVKVHYFPLTLNGKIDKKQLPLPQKFWDSSITIPLVTDKELLLARLWSEILNIDIQKIGKNSDFFYLGGDSIKAIQLVAKLKKENWLLKVSDVLETSLLELMAEKLIENKISNNTQKLQGKIPLTPIQYQFLNNLILKGDITEKQWFNQSQIFYFDAHSHKSDIQNILNFVLEHHEILKTRFYKENEKWIAEITDSFEIQEFQFDNMDLESPDFQDACNQVHKSLNFLEGKNVAIGYFALKNQWAVLISIHHLVVDFVSWQILNQDIQTVYHQWMNHQSFSLSPAQNSIKEYVNHLENLYKEGFFEPEINKIYNNFKPSNAFLSFDNSKNTFENSLIESIIIENQSFGKIQEVVRKYEIHSLTLIIESFYQALKKQLGIDSIIINLESHGRKEIDSIDLSNSVGWFTTIYPIFVENQDLKENLWNIQYQIKREEYLGLGYQYAIKNQALKPIDSQISINYFGKQKADIQTTIPLGNSIHPKLQRNEIFEILITEYPKHIQLEIIFPKEFQNQIADIHKEFNHFILQISNELINSTTQKLPYLFSYHLLQKPILDSILKKFPNVEDIRICSPLQEGLIYELQQNPFSQNYMEQFSFHLRGDLEEKHIIDSLQILTQNFEILRTVFQIHSDQFLQIILKEVNTEFCFYDSVSDWEKFLFEDRNTPFDISQKPPFRFHFIKIHGKGYHVVWTYHHILMDGWSVSIVLDAWLDILNSTVQNLHYPKLTISNSNYYKWLLRKLNSLDAKNYWKNYLANFEQSRSLTKILDYKEYDLQEITFSLEGEFYQNLIEWSKNHKVTLNTFVQTVWGILLGKYTYENDVIFGTVVSGRSLDVPNMEKMVGLFINTLPKRIQWNDHQDFIDLCKQVQNDFIQSENYQYLGLSEIQTLSGLGNQLFDHLFIFENYPEQTRRESTSPKVSIDYSTYKSFEQIGYDLNILVEAENQLFVKFKYNQNAYSHEFISHLAWQYQYLINYLISHQATKIQEIIFHHENQTLSIINQNPSSLIQLFENQCRISPEATALIYNQEVWNYSQFNEITNQFANYLLERLENSSNFITVELPKSEYLLMAIWGVLKCGKAYIPIDPDYPEERKNSIFEDSLPCFKINENTIQDFLQKKRNFSQNFKSLAAPHLPAYCIYTSGSTGKPKGCVITHEQITFKLQNLWNQFFTVQESILHLTNFTFDVSITEIIMPLLYGASLVMVPQNKVTDYEYIIDLMAENSVTSLHVVPTVLNELSVQAIQKVKSLKRVIAAGEALPPAYVKKWYQYSDALLYNLYGPTETTIYVTYYLTQPKDQLIPIGKPIQGVETLILGKNLELLPKGAIGELCIGGDSLGLGYWNRPELNAQKFILRKGKRIYRTGDLVRELPDGNLEYLGRIDEQVKIRGYRIELEEITNVLLKQEGIEQAVTLVKKVHSEPTLVSYYVGTVKAENLKNALLDSLPNYMVPTHYVNLTALPLTPNGKVDKKQLSLLNELEINFIEPLKTEREQQVALIWSEILQIPLSELGRNSDFFRMGGNSIKGIKLIGKLERQLGIQLNIRTLFKYSDLKTFTEVIYNPKTKTISTIIPQIGEEPFYPVSSAQRRLWVLSQLEGAETAYNVHYIKHVTNAIIPEIFEKVIQKIVERHEILRTYFVEDSEGNPHQKLVLPQDYAIDYIYEIVQTNEIQEVIQKNLESELDIRSQNLWKVRLIEIENQGFLIMMLFHHIIIDEWSIELLEREIELLYFSELEGKKEELPSLLIQYKDYAVYQQSLDLGKQKSYWLEKFRGEIPILEFPRFQPRPLVKTYNGGVIQRNIHKTNLKGFYEVIQKSGVTVFSGLMSLVYGLLQKYTQQEDIIIGIPHSGRKYPETQEVLGFFINTLPIRIEQSGDQLFREVLKFIQQELLNAYENSEYSYDDLVDSLKLPRDLSRNPLFDVMVAYSYEEQKSKSQWETQTITITHNRQAKFDLTFGFVESPEGLYVELEYNSDLYASDYMQSVLELLCEWIEKLGDYQEKKLYELPLIEGSESSILRESLPILQKNVVEIWEEAVRNNLDKIALKFENKSYTYRAIEEKSNRLGRYIQSKVGQNSKGLIGIQLERSEWLIISIIAVIKTGNAYLPIDPNYPEARKEFMIEDSQAQLIINEEFIQEFIENENRYSPEKLGVKIEPEDVIYCIYTSGSTGLPKGCLVSHGNVMNIHEGWKKVFFGL